MCKEDSKYICEFCNKVCRSKSGLVQHKVCCKSNPNRISTTNYYITELNKSKAKEDGWTCRYCGKVLNTWCLLLSHYKEDHSDCYRSYSKHEWECTYCNCKFRTKHELHKHFKECNERNKQSKDSLGRIIPSYNELYKCEFCGTICKSSFGLTTHIKYCDCNPYKKEKRNIAISDETRVKMSIAARKRIGYSANFNPNACKYIYALNEEKGWHLQHALNGGEITVGPYFLDGYDKELNIAFEYDERKHHCKKKRKHDIVKQNYIINTLKCKFYRFDENLNTLYEVDYNQSNLDF